MTAHDVCAVVVAIVQGIAPDADLASIDPEGDMRRQVDLDSLDFQQLVEQVAATTGVEIPETDYPSVRSLHGMCQYLAVRIPGPGGTTHPD